MRNTLTMAWRHVRFFKAKTAILVLGITCTITLPLASHLIISRYGTALRSRAASTPYILGARGNRFGLMLKTLYFGDARVDPITLEDINKLERSEWGRAIPMHLGHTAQYHPIVGVPGDYADFRDFAAREGVGKPELGEAVLGSTVAHELEAKVGGQLVSDLQSLYDIGGEYPVRLRVAGILEPTHSADDHAVFVSLKTTWLMDGLLHGHAGEHDDTTPSEGKPIQYRDVTPENAGEYHLHAFPAEIPVSAAIIIPTGDKGATILQARYDASDRLQLQDTRLVVEEILGLVVQVQSFFDSYYVLVIATTIMFIGLIVALSSQLRKREMETMRLIGASRGFTLGLQAAELLIIVGISTLCAGMLTLVCLRMAQHFFALPA